MDPVDTKPPVHTEYYDLLGVSFNCKEKDLKIAYHKAAMKYHPDRNKSPEAEEKFKSVSAAYQVLSDPNRRTAYDKYGKSMESGDDNITMEDAAKVFGRMFGGDSFLDYVGKISLMEEITEAAQTVMTEPEKAEVEKQMNAGSSRGISQSPAHVDPETGPTESPSAPCEKPPVDETQPTTREKKRPKLTPEQQKKLKELEDQKRKAMEDRVETLTKQLIERLRPFETAKNPGDSNDLEVMAFKEKMRNEATDLQQASFGTELLHTIGLVYTMKATSFLKSKKYLGIPGFFSRMKEKGALAKDAWGVIGSALSVQGTLKEIDKLKEMAKLPEAEAEAEALLEASKALEGELTGKILLASWKGVRFECVRVLREVCDNVLKDPGASETILLNRAKGLLLLGSIYKEVVPDESRSEQRELERIVEAAAKPKRHRTQDQAKEKPESAQPN